MLATRQLGLERAVLVDEHAPQAVAGRSALAIPQFDEAALASEYFGRELAAVLPGHCALHAFDDG